VQGPSQVRGKSPGSVRGDRAAARTLTRQPDRPEYWPTASSTPRLTNIGRRACETAQSAPGVGVTTSPSTAGGRLRPEAAAGACRSACPWTNPVPVAAARTPRDF